MSVLLQEMVRMSGLRFDWLQGLMGECGDCSGLGTSVPHTVVD
jgi:hypothetical protein